MYYLQGFESRAEKQYEEASSIDDYETDFVRRARRFTIGGRW